MGTGTESFSFFWWYRNRYRKKMVPEKSLGTGIGQIWYRKKVSEPVSEKFGTGKAYRYRYRKYLVPEKSIGIGIVQHFGYRHTLVRSLEKCLGFNCIAHCYSVTVVNCLSTSINVYIDHFKRQTTALEFSVRYTYCVSLYCTVAVKSILNPVFLIKIPINVSNLTNLI